MISLGGGVGCVGGLQSDRSKWGTSGWATGLKRSAAPTSAAIVGRAVGFRWSRAHTRHAGRPLEEGRVQFGHVVHRRKLFYHHMRIISRKGKGRATEVSKETSVISGEYPSLKLQVEQQAEGGKSADLQTAKYKAWQRWPAIESWRSEGCQVPRATDRKPTGTPMRKG